MIPATIYFVSKLSWRSTKTPWDGVPGFWAAVNRFFYIFEGPAQLGTSGHERPETPPEQQRCPICGELLTAHVIEPGGPGEQTYLHCPP